MPVAVLLIVLIVLFIVLLLAADRAVKAIRRGRRRADANKRLVAAVDRGKAKHRQRKAAADASRALTSVIPTIHDHPVRHVDDPAATSTTAPDASTNPLPLPIGTVPRVP
jgi:type II secretory pathway pseudopilin PulG